MFNKFNRRAIKWIALIDKKLLFLIFFLNILLCIEPYILFFVIQIVSDTGSEMLKFHYTLIAGSLALLLIIDALKLILKRLKDTSEIKLRANYNKTLALKRIAMSNSYNKELLDMSYIIDDYQQYNGGPIIEAYRILDDSLKVFFATITSVILCISYINNANSYLIYLFLIVITLVISSLFYNINTRIENDNLKVQNQMMENNRLGNFYFSLLTSEFSSMKSLRNYSINNFIENKYSGFMNPMIKSYRQYSLKKTVSDTIRLLVNAGFTLLAILLLLSNTKTTFNLVLLFALFNSTYNISNFILLLNNRKANNKRLETLFSFLDAEIFYSDKKTHDSKTVLINVNSLSFQYPNQHNFALKNINLKFEKSKIYTIVGSNGSGKTTLIKHLIALMGNSHHGTITYNKDISEVVIPYCPQKNPIFSFTIGENIALSEVYDEQKIHELLLNLDLNINSAQIAKLKLGHDFSNNGIDLSGGQEQKIGIARALYFDKNIIILDEPTASLDVSAENIIYELVKKFRNQRTCIFVSHRLSSSKFSDHIIVMHNGEVVGQGTHTILLDTNEYYKKLFEAQAKHYYGS
jgi:ABC transporter, ATP-binding protein